MGQENKGKILLLIATRLRPLDVPYDRTDVGPRTGATRALSLPSRNGSGGVS